MKGIQRPLGFIVALALGLALILGGFTQPARAASEDVAMFYDDLSQYGQWVDYENYGPVWTPSNVGEDWRPYTDGRWTPTDDGYVFESQEPWGWATYHYGNWMPTEGYGWVWTPGRTWYPSTVEWRTSPEDAPVDTSYIGWAPIPPPDYVPTQSYAPQQYYGQQQGYYPGAPGADPLSSPLWVFARAASFLLGFGQPYNSGYSYGGCGCLAPPSYVPTFFPQTMYVSNYYTPNYYPRSYFGRGFRGAYGYGPPVRYVSRVTRINQTIINRRISYNSTHLTGIHNIRPPHDVLTRNAGIRQITPPALVAGRQLPRSQRLTNVNTARANMGKPNLVNAPKNVPPLTAQIPKASALGTHPGRTGAALPAKATMKLTPQQQQQIQKLPPPQQVQPAKPPLAGKPAVQPGAPKPGQVPPAVPGKPGQVQPGAKPGAVTPGTKPGQFQPGVPSHPGAVTPGAKPGQVQPGGPTHPGTFKPGASEKPGPVHPGAQPGKLPAQPPSGSKPPTTEPGHVKPGTPQPGHPAAGQFKPATPAQPTRPQPQVQPTRPQPQAAPRPQPQMQPRPTPQPQIQPRPQPQPQRVAPPPQPRPQMQAPRPQPAPQPRPQVQQPRPQPQPQRVAPAPQSRPQMQQNRPAPQVQPRPQAAPHPQAQPQKPQKQEQKKPGEHQ